jgi:predicted aldo/keto reductase-like oxidoreductase
MKYRKFGKIDEEVSLLGFGTMRLPTNNGNLKDIDLEKTTKLIRYAIDHGVNYVDTAWPYHGGMSEKAVGKALSDGYREKVHLATKLPSFLVNKPEDFDDFLDQQLKNLQTDRIDYYLIHTLNKVWWPKLKELGLFEFIERAKASGKVKYVGFSFHDSIEVFKDIVDGWDWDFCQIQLNFMDEEYQAGVEGLKYAAAKGLGVVVMEPLKGGKIVKPNPRAEKLWAKADKVRTPPEWAFRWVADFPEVSVVLSGMGELDEVVENILTMSEAEPGSLTRDEHELIGEVRDMYKKYIKIQCTACGYCMPCPYGVNIPRNLELYNDTFMFDVPKEANRAYWGFFTEANKASNCRRCGICEAACPQGLKIMDLLELVDEKMNEIKDKY